MKPFQQKASPSYWAPPPAGFYPFRPLTRPNYAVRMPYYIPPSIAIPFQAPEIDETLSDNEAIAQLKAWKNEFDAQENPTTRQLFPSSAPFSAQTITISRSSFFSLLRSISISTRTLLVPGLSFG